MIVFRADYQRLFNRLSATLVFCTILITGRTDAQEAQVPWSGEGAVREINHIAGDLYIASDEKNHNTVFLVTTDGVILADTNSLEFASWIKGELADRFGVPVRYQINSHAHFDHAEGSKLFADTAIFVGHEDMAKELASPKVDFMMNPDANGDGRISRDEASPPLQHNFDRWDTNGDDNLSRTEINVNIAPLDITYSDKMTLTLGGQTVELFHPGLAHSPGMTVIYFPKEKTIFAVDFVNINRLPGGLLAGSDFEQFEDALSTVAAYDFELVVPGHYKKGTKEDLLAYIGYYRDIRFAVEQGISQGKSLAELQESIHLDNYSDWLRYEKSLGANIAQAFEALTVGGETL